MNIRCKGNGRKSTFGRTRCSRPELQTFGIIDEAGREPDSQSGLDRRSQREIVVDDHFAGHATDERSPLSVT